MLTPDSASVPADAEPFAHNTPRDTRRSIVGAATIISIGNLSSRVVGLFREIAKSYFFGNGRMASAFELASNPPSQFYDLLVGGMLSSALVPTFSNLVGDESDENQLAEFGRLLGALIGLASVALAALVALLWMFAGPLAGILAGNPNQDLDLVANLLRVTIPTIIFLNLSGIFTAALYARRKFAITAFTATIFNLTMIACVALLERSLSITALAVGMLAGSILQCAMQVPGLKGIPIKLSLNWRHPGISHIMQLFLPVAGGLALAQLAALVSFILAGHTGTEGPATMRYAAQVIQFPLGMTAVAVSSAILPSLSAYGRASSLGDFKATLAHGLRLVWVLIVPASVGLFVLAQPVVALLFERGEFSAASTAYTAQALRAAVPGLVFAAIDQPLIYAFYAQRDTRTPTLIGLASTLSYLALVGALSLLSQYGLRDFTLNDLILANSLKTGVDVCLMAICLSRKIGGLQGFDLWPLALKVCAASALMGVAVWWIMTLIQHRLGDAPFFTNAITALAAAGIGVVVYLGCTALLRVQEFTMLRGILKR
ncbi:MAG: murein biosynthesis integral membrane protein MurJ [Chloroflexi bacterium]|nr:murein biosynthesis integral membrane protein MurJ [Chloroflexota bacterium]